MHIPKRLKSCTISIDRWLNINQYEKVNSLQSICKWIDFDGLISPADRDERLTIFWLGEIWKMFAKWISVGRWKSKNHFTNFNNNNNKNEQTHF